MKLSFVLGILLVALLLAPAPAQGQAVPADDQLEPVQFSEVLKNEWTFLREETEKFLAATSARGEFETTPEFEERSAREKQNYLLRISQRMKDQKLDTRTFGVLLKAKLVSYNADRREYFVACSVAVEAPYTIPSIQTFVPTNRFVYVQDTIVGGYRTSRLMLKFRPHYVWQVERGVASEAKAEEQNLYFRVRSVVDITQPNLKNQALLRVVPKEIQLVHAQKGTVYWREEIK